MANVVVEVSHSQLSVFAVGLNDPFNDWTERHVAQGFSWRPGSVSFRTLVEAGRHSVDIQVLSDLNAVSADAIRAIEVPFDLASDGGIEVGSISDGAIVLLATESYMLRCEFFGPAPGGDQRVRLTFLKSGAPAFRVVRADEDLSPGPELLKTASPA